MLFWIVVTLFVFVTLSIIAINQLKDKDTISGNRIWWWVETIIILLAIALIVVAIIANNII